MDQIEIWNYDHELKGRIYMNMWLQALIDNCQSIMMRLIRIMGLTYERDNVIKENVIACMRILEHGKNKHDFSWIC